MVNKHKFVIENVPVFWRESESHETVPGIPDRHILSLEADEKTGLLKQTYSHDTDVALGNMYSRDENIGYLREDHPLSKIYGPEFLDFIDGHICLSGKKVLDIGCGGLYILKRLKELHAEVLGCDPSPFAAAEGVKNSIQVISDFFPSEKIAEKQDLIIHFDVLEHIWDPESFLKGCFNQLCDQGVIVFSIPDCGEQIKNSDITLFAHQHVNFFTKSSISALMALVGFTEILVERSPNTGKLQCFGRKSDKA